MSLNDTTRTRRARLPHMGTLRLGGTPPPLERRGLSTPPRSLERNKISTVYLPTSTVKSSTPKEKSRNHQLFNPNFSNVNLKNIHVTELWREEGVAGKVDGSEGRGGRAGSCSSQGSSGVSSSSQGSSGVSSCSQGSSGVSSCSCRSMVTVNGQHHCSGQTEDESSSCQSSPIIVQV